MNFSRRPGWLLLILLITHILFNRFAHGVPVEPRQMASEVKLNSQTVRVKLSGFGNVLSIHGTDLAMSLAQKPELGNVRADEWVVNCKKNLIVQPATGKARALPRTGVLIESASGVLSVNERRFRDQIVVYPSCLVVNHLNVEKYLESVVNGEFNSQWAENAVKAQVIAARTYALYQMNTMRRDPSKVFDVESTQKDQVYLGLDSADLRGSRLVAETRGIIMSDPASKTHAPIKAFYHAACGGNTVLPQEVWGNKFAGFSKRVRCPFCGLAPSFHWEYQMSFYEIQKKIMSGLGTDPAGRKAWPLAYSRHPEQWILMGVKTQEKFSHPKAMSLIADASAEVSAEARVDDLIFEFANRDHLDKKLVVKMNAYQARNWFDPAKVKSTLFNVAQVGRSIIFQGKGSGHGVGMCQWGAKRMGEKGYSAEKILSFYYPGVKISRVW